MYLISKEFGIPFVKFVVQRCERLSHRILSFVTKFYENQQG